MMPPRLFHEGRLSLVLAHQRAARFKQGLGFSSGSDAVPERGSSDRRRYRSRESDERDRSHRRRSRSAERRSSVYGDRERRRRRSRSRSSSPRRERRRSEDDRRGRRRGDVKEKKKIDYSHLIKGYDDMSAAEKVKAKMKLQLHETRMWEDVAEMVRRGISPDVCTYNTLICRICKDKELSEAMDV
ncbi:hypothetical protein F2Q69_00040504 [Brassica cretica]|uniref:Uncharacterized protein n=1 Tax=Brassica cretica TaxID=69181 RepID=A0A8S9NS15_BRACR|nr:hypothetical protein F2Q69_00040504 [Brassica cretica]